MKRDYALHRIENLFVGAACRWAAWGEGFGKKGEISHAFFVLYGQFYKVLNFPVFCSSHLLFLCTLLSTQLKQEVAAVSASSEGLSQDVSLMHVYLSGKAGALMLVWWKITFPAFLHYLSVFCLLLANVAGVGLGDLMSLLGLGKEYWPVASFR